jgi:hypothetical protein
VSIINDTEVLRSEILTFVQSCGDGDDLADEVLGGILEIHRLTGRSLKEIWHKHVLSVCCLERMVQLGRAGLSY